ncbi:hypothetical protein I4U23_024024 [Adineta vaga]|nr:hypothetical protein I4U23_024024 [Adineta vaga]
MHFCDTKIFLILSTFYFSLTSSISIGHTQGTITIDNLTFDKILSRFDAVLVKFDDKFPFGTLQDDFKALVESSIKAKDFAIAEIPVTDRDEQENFHFALDFDAMKPDFPVYMLFMKDRSKRIRYVGDRSMNDLRRFLLRHLDIWIGLTGTVEALDRMGREFYDATRDKNENEQTLLLEKARDIVQKMENQKDQKNGETYVKIMEAVIKHGIEYFQREERRIHNLIKGKISKEKKAELIERENVLLSFRLLREATNNATEQVQGMSGKTVGSHQDL